VRDCSGGIALLTSDSRHDGVGNAGRRLIRPAKEEASRPHLAIKPVSLSKRSVSSGMGYLRLACQAFMRALSLPQLGGVVPPVAAGQRDAQDSGCGHAP
jgi:hypothetical protein